MPLHIGIAGAGMIGSTHAAVLQQIARADDRVVLAAVADPIESQRELFRSAFGFRRAFASADEMLRHGDIDTLFVCTPTHEHAELVHAAAARKLNLFCEKPLAMTYREGRAMVEATQRAGCRTQIGLVLRYSAVFSVLRELALRPENGRAMSVIFRDDQCFPIRGLHDTAWRANHELTAGGTLIEHGVHDVDILVHMFGPMRRVRAWERNFAGHKGVEDYLAAEIEFESGLRAQLINLWHNILQRGSNRRIEIFAENAFVATEHDMVGEILHQTGDEPLASIAAEEVLRRFTVSRAATGHPLRDWFGVPYLVQDLDFVDSVLSGRDPSPSLADGLEAQRLAEALYFAARTGTEVHVREFEPPSGG